MADKITECRIKVSDIKEFSRLAKELSDLNDKIREYCPDAHTYMYMDALMLVVGEPNPEYCDRDMKDAIGVVHQMISGADCGADNGLQYDPSYDKYRYTGTTQVMKKMIKEQEEEILRIKYQGYCNGTLRQPISYEEFKKIFGKPATKRR